MSTQLVYIGFIISDDVFFKCLLFLAACLIMGDRVATNSLDKRTSFAKRTDKDTYYNIYSKINALEKDLKNLKTRLQKKTSCFDKSCSRS